MKRLSLAATIVLASMLAAVIGCSDDDENPTGSHLQVGDTTTATFRFIDSTLAGEDVLEDFELSVNLFEALTAALPGGSARVNHPRAMLTAGLDAEDSVDVSSIIDWSWTAGNWLVIEFEATVVSVDGSDTSEVMVAGIDSIQFLLDGVVLDSAGAWEGDFDGLRTNVHAAADGFDGENSVTGAVHRRLEILGGHNNNDSLGIVNATARDTVTFDLSDDSGSCLIELVNHPTIDDIVLNLVSEECPESGSVARTVSIDLSCQSNDGLNQLDIEGTWTVTATVNGDGTITVTYSDGTTAWTVTRPCEVA
ncbi:MAG: hypothetical protein RBT76_02115 [candidate division Zixibacteria bacterium]|jgi:hypothetical protein|nr:hypothetical protein [candidate division Zixibacteria bacterium]